MTDVLSIKYQVTHGPQLLLPCASLTFYLKDVRLTTATGKDKKVQANIDDLIKVLKVRFAKGEIRKEQYEEMRKMIES